MTISTYPLFESHDDFLDQDFTVGRSSIRSVNDYLESFAEELRAIDGYLAARAYLRQYAENPLTFSTYRCQVERLLLWSLNVLKQPITELKRLDAEAFLAFCKNPPASWVGPIIRNRFLDNHNLETTLTHPVVMNPKWRPFTQKTPKQFRGDLDKSDVPTPQGYHSSKGSMGNVFKICSGFYEYLIEEDLAGTNPFRKVTKKNQYNATPDEGAVTRALTPLQWDNVVDTAEAMAASEPNNHDRTLVSVITTFRMFRRIPTDACRRTCEPSNGQCPRTTKN